MPTKRFVCLAKSIRDRALCIAGKEYSNGAAGPWFRPVGREKDAISADSCSLNIGDMVHCRVDGHTPDRHQSENHILSAEPSWVVEGAFPSKNLGLFLDSPSSIWENGFDCSSRHGMNDRVPEHIAGNFDNSLYFLFVPKARVIMQDEGYERPCKKVRLAFQYNGTAYTLRVTAPNLSNLYWNRLQIGESDVIGKCYITVSLTMPFHGHCYKLVAGYVPV